MRAGDREFLKTSWDSIVKAYRFSEATDTDRNGLIENTGAGHGWVEGGALYPPHEEVYLQGLWIEALREHRGACRRHERSGTRADALAQRGSARATRSKRRTGWRIAASTPLRPPLPRKEPPVAEPGPDRARRQARLDALRDCPARSTRTPSSRPFRSGSRRSTLRERNSQIDHLGAGALATDWGSRILSERSELYDPLSYHYGSVWPLFTGWASMGAYRYGRPHVGFQALMANALLTYDGALGYVTELLSGEFNAAFGRSSHHQVWSEAMVVTPVLRGLFGIEPSAAGGVLRCAPQLPANWDSASAHNISAGDARFDFTFARTPGRLTATIDRRASTGRPVSRLILAPAFPLDAIVRSVSVNGRPAKFERRSKGDVQQAEVVIPEPARRRPWCSAMTGAATCIRRSSRRPPAPGIRDCAILRSRAGRDALVLTLEGRAGRTYSLSDAHSAQAGRRLGR